MPQNIFRIDDIFELGNIADRGLTAPPPIRIGNRDGVGLVTTVGTQLRQFAPTKRPILGGARQQFMWLPYSPGTTNYVECPKVPVLSGPFSGCYMIVYRQGMKDYVCHVATPEAKASWNRFANLPGVDVLRGFQPHANVCGPDIPPFVTVGTTGDQPGAFSIFGLIMDKNEMYALFTYKQQVNGAFFNTRFRIAAISGPIVSLPINVLKNLP